MPHPCTVKAGGSAHFVALLQILFYPEAAVLMTAKDDGVVLVAVSACLCAAKLTVLPPLGARLRFKNEGRIVVTCKESRRCYPVFN